MNINPIFFFFFEGGHKPKFRYKNNTFSNFLAFSCQPNTKTYPNSCQPNAKKLARTQTPTPTNQTATNQIKKEVFKEKKSSFSKDKLTPEKWKEKKKELG